MTTDLLGYLEDPDDEIWRMGKPQVEFSKNQDTEYPASNGQDRKPFWQRIVELGAQVPEEEWKKLPKDFARNFEHYMYGVPK